MLKLNGKQLVVTIISPSNASFQILDASYLPGQIFPFTKNSVNKGFKKLAIKLEGEMKGKIQVIFKPQKF